MQTKGYAETSLTDLAKAAGMSVSHLLYYFPSKEAVLEQLCSGILERIVTEITAYKDEPPEERIHVLVDHVFIRGALPREELGVVFELIALSLHRPKIRRMLMDYDREMTGYVRDLFTKVPRQPGLTPDDAALMACALWMGLFTNSHYDPALDDGRARRLFRRSLFAMANLEHSRTQTSGATAGRA
jgi:AcrR family transcriptional regulator